MITNFVLFNQIFQAYLKFPAISSASTGLQYLAVANISEKVEKLIVTAMKIVSVHDFT